MQKNGRCIVLVNGTFLRKLAKIWQIHACLHILGIIESISGHDPAFELFAMEPIEIWSAGHAIFEVSIAKAARKVQFSIDAILFSLLQHNASSIYNLH